MSVSDRSVEMARFEETTARDVADVQHQDMLEATEVLCQAISDLAACVAELTAAINTEKTDLPELN